MASSRILVAGGSLGGLLVAHLLLRQGHDVLVLEKSRDFLDGRGAGIVTHSRLVEILSACGAVIDDSLGVKVDERVVLGPDGKDLARSQYTQVLTSWSRLYRLLLDPFPKERYVLGAELSNVVADEHGVSLSCSDGRSYKGDLLIAADGVRSTIRGQLAPEVKPEYAGYIAWRGVCDEAGLSQHTLNTLFGKFGFGLPEHEQMLGYPVAGQGNNTRPGKRCYNFVWYRPATPDQLRALLTDADGHYHETGIPPHKVDWRAVAGVRDDARRLLAPQFAEILQKTAQPFLQPIFDVDSKRIAFGRVALLGDAAFVARPHVGMGVTKAAEDAESLVRAIATHGVSPKALLAYEAERVPACAAVVRRAQHLGAYLEAQTRIGTGAATITAAEGTAAAGANRDVAEILRETAIDLALA